MTVGISKHRWNAIIRSELYAFAILFRIETERAILVMRGMKIATREKWADA
jgi:hypothetical protein